MRYLFRSFFRYYVCIYSALSKTAACTCHNFICVLYQRKLYIIPAPCYYVCKTRHLQRCNKHFTLPYRKIAYTVAYCIF